jgi:hypothetical protein
VRALPAPIQFGSAAPESSGANVPRRFRSSCAMKFASKDSASRDYRNNVASNLIVAGATRGCIDCRVQFKNSFRACKTRDSAMPSSSDLELCGSVRTKPGQCRAAHDEFLRAVVIQRRLVDIAGGEIMIVARNGSCWGIVRRQFRGQNRRLRARFGAARSVFTGKPAYRLPT